MAETLTSVLKAIFESRGTLSQSDAAAMLCISKSPFRHRFKKLTGSSFRAKRVEIKVTIAAELLEKTDWTVPAIAAHLGYSDHTDLEKVFKKAYGVTPLEYRAAVSKSND